MTITQKVRGVDIAVADTGSGLPFLWGHGLAGSMEQEDEYRFINWVRLARKYRVIRWDARGHGQSTGAPVPDDYRWHNLAQDLLALADALGVERFVAGGASMGAATALHAATMAPARVIAIVLVLAPTAWESRDAQADLYRATAVLVERLGLDAYLEQMSSFPGPEILGDFADRYPPPPHVSEQLYPSVCRGAAASDFPTQDAVRGLRMPALVLPWVTDPGHPLSTSERLVELLPDVQVHVAHELGDVATWTDRIDAFLEPLSAATDQDSSVTPKRSM
jgi:3-oxoadipate enol-lactonase